MNDKNDNDNKNDSKGRKPFDLLQGEGKPEPKRTHREIREADFRRHAKAAILDTNRALKNLAKASEHAKKAESELRRFASKLPDMIRGGQLRRTGTAILDATAAALTLQARLEDVYDTADAATEDLLRAMEGQPPDGD